LLRPNHWLLLSWPRFQLFRGIPVFQAASQQSRMFAACVHHLHKKETPMPWRCGVLLTSIFAILSPVASLAQPATTAVPKDIAVPPGHDLLFKVEAKGVQIYKAVEGKGGAFEWALEAPLADLFEEKGKKAGWHYEGPSWEAVDGSKVVRDKTEDVKSAPAPRPKQDIPWLLLKVKAAEGKEGKWSPAVYIQRLRTEGGKAPAELPKRVGTKVGVEYKAVYYFYGQAK
jgi:hypothetical protein